MAAKVVRVVVLLILLVVLGYVLWLKRFHGAQNADPEEATMEAQDQADHKEDLARGGEAREAAVKLEAMKLQLGRGAPEPGSNAPPTYLSLECTGRKLGDEGFALIGKCFTFDNLTLIDTDINDSRAKSLAGLKRLNSLVIIRTGRDKDAGTLSDAGLRCLESMPRMTGLTLNGTGVGDDGLKIIGRLVNLGMLSLDGTEITDAGLPAIHGLKKLQWLVISNTAITDAGVAQLQGLSSLGQVSLKGSKVTEKGRAALRKMYPHLQID